MMKNVGATFEKKNQLKVMTTELFSKMKKKMVCGVT